MEAVDDWATAPDVLTAAAPPPIDACLLIIKACTTFLKEGRPLIDKSGGVADNKFGGMLFVLIRPRGGSEMVLVRTPVPNDRLG